MASLVNLLVNFKPVFHICIGLVRTQAICQNEALDLHYPLYQGILAALAGNGLFWPLKIRFQFNFWSIDGSTIQF